MTIPKYDKQDLNSFMRTGFNDLVKKVNNLKDFNLSNYFYSAYVDLPLNKDIIVSHNLGKTIVSITALQVVSDGVFTPNTSLQLKFLSSDGGINKNSILIYNTNASLVGRHLLTLIGV